MKVSVGLTRNLPVPFHFLLVTHTLHIQSLTEDLLQYILDMPKMFCLAQSENENDEFSKSTSVVDSDETAFFTILVMLVNLSNNEY